MALKVPNKYRVREGNLGSTDAFGSNGMFAVPYSNKINLTVIASDYGGWEHVSVSTLGRCPTWEEMEYIKRMFWEEEDVALQFHPSLSAYVNTHPYCLHMWRKVGTDHELPPRWMIG